MKPKLNEDFGTMGLELSKFFVENISFPPEVEAALDKRSQMGILGDLGRYTQFQTANAIEEARADFLLKRANLRGDGGLRDAQLLRCAREALQPADLLKRS